MVKCRSIGIVVNSLLFFLCVWLYPSTAQVRNIDSLRAAIPGMPDDTNKVNALLNLSLQYLNTSDYAATQACLEMLHSISKQLHHKRGVYVYYVRSGLVSHYLGQYPDALDNLGTALQMAKEMKSRRAIADCYTNMGMIYSALGKYTDALQHYTYALDFRDAEDLRGKSATFTNIGIIYHQLGDYPNALKYYLLSLKIDEQLGDKMDLAFTYNNLGLFYESQHRTYEAISYYVKANTLCQEVSHQECIAGTNANIANLYKKEGNYQAALTYYERSLQIFREIDNQPEIAATLGNMGVLYHLMGEYALALEYLKSALALHQEKGERGKEAIALLNLGKVCVSLQRYEDARQYVAAGIVIASEISAREQIAQGYLHLSHLDSLTGNYLQALAHFKQYKNHEDSILNESNLATIAELEKQFESERKDKEILRLESDQEIAALLLRVKNEMLKKSQADQQRLSAQNLVKQQQVEILKAENKFRALEVENHKADLAVQQTETEKLARQAEIKHIAFRKQRMLNYYLLGGLALLLTLAFVVYNNYLIRQRLKLQTLRNKIASDLHDDVGSTLSSISIFSEMAQKQSREVIPALQTIGESSRKMLDAMADIVWTINPENDQLERILLRMRNFAYDLLGAKKIDFEFKSHGDTSSLKLPMEVRKNLYLIFKEATNNMVKYSDADKASYSIKNEKDQLIMQIRDNGKGFDVNSVAEGNGLRNMRKRAAEIGGILLIDSLPGSGTTIRLSVAV